MKLIKSFPPEEPIVGMIEFRGRLLVASAKRIYELKGDTLEPLEMIEEPIEPVYKMYSDETDF